MGSKLDDIQSPKEKDKAEKAVARRLAIFTASRRGSVFFIPASYPRSRAVSGLGLPAGLVISFPDGRARDTEGARSTGEPPSLSPPRPARPVPPGPRARSRGGWAYVWGS